MLQSSSSLYFFDGKKRQDTKMNKLMGHFMTRINGIAVHDYVRIFLILDLFL